MLWILILILVITSITAASRKKNKVQPPANPAELQAIYNEAMSIVSVNVPPTDGQPAHVRWEVKYNPCTPYFYDLSQGSQEETKWGVTLSPQWLTDTAAKYNWDQFSSDDNLVRAMAASLNDPVLKQVEGGINFTATWEGLNRPQKVFMTWLNLNYWTSQGGLIQFFYQHPQQAFAAYQMLFEINASTQLINDYAAAFGHFYVKLRIISAQKGNRTGITIYPQDREMMHQEWNQKRDFPNGEAAYFNNQEFQRDFSKQIGDYVSANFNRFLVPEEGAPKA